MGAQDIVSGHIIERDGRFSWRRSIRGITIQIPLRTSGILEAREIATTAASYSVFHDILHSGLDRATGKGMIGHRARMASARMTLRKGGEIRLCIPITDVATMRFAGMTEEQIGNEIRGRGVPHPEDLAGWKPEDVAEYLAAYAGVPYSFAHRSERSRSSDVRLPLRGLIKSIHRPNVKMWGNHSGQNPPKKTAFTPQHAGASMSKDADTRRFVETARKVFGVLF